MGFQNVCLLRDSHDPLSFYPRFDMEKITSYADLDDHR